jgi:hypothetical protein
MLHFIRSRNSRGGTQSFQARQFIVGALAHSTIAVIACALLTGSLSQPAVANITLDGNVLLYALRDSPMYYGEDPFTSFEEGIPTGGNVIEGFRGLPGGPCADPGGGGCGQVRFEGRLDVGPTVSPFDDENINFHIVVGRTSSAQLSILGGSDLRDMDLVIGDAAELEGELSDGLRLGTGIVRIDGEGSLYNNDPDLLPFFLGQNPDTPMSPSKVPRQDEPDAEDGFDLWVGRGGTGSLQITAGGRAEILDTVVIGDQGTATGTISVDGFNSFLGTSGFPGETPSRTNIADYGGMIVGRLGTGLVNITNGGQVVAFGRQQQASQPAIAAVIGSNPYDFQGSGSQPPEAGGLGVVSVDGAGSKWIVGGTLQVGGFHNSEFMSLADVKGIGAVYASNVGRGTLNVANDGLVNLIFPSDGTTSSDELFALLIGRFGRLNLGGELGGGRVVLSSGFETTGGGTDPDALLENAHVINDGLIRGDGYIGAGRLLNRALGEIHVDAGNALVFDARGGVGEIDNTMVLPFQNFGVIRAAGSESARAEMEFVGESTLVPTSDLAFFNGRLNAGEISSKLNGGRTFGLIHAQHGTLRFRSDLRNQGELAFTAGDNIVGGNVVNLPVSSGAAGFVDEGKIVVTGNRTSVAFENDLINDGTIQVDPGNFFSVLGNLSGGGAFDMAFGSSAFGASIGHIAVGGDKFRGGTLNVSIGPSAPTFMAGDAFEILSTAGQLGVFSIQNMPPLTGGLVMFPDYDLMAGTLTLRVISPMTVIGADFNGDGIVDLADLAILQANLGITMGALPQQGDSDLDGDVDGQDFLRWQGQVGGPGMPGAGFGSSAGFAANVPEPATYALAMCGLLALVVHRRRTR